MTVSELLARISSKELTEWMAFYRLEPFGSDTQYLGPAINTAMLANIHKKKGAKSAEVGDFMPDFRRKERQSIDEMIGLVAAYNAAFGGTDDRE